MSKKEQNSVKEIEEEPRFTVPNNLDYIIISGLMEGSFSGPFEMDFEGNHTIIAGSNGRASVYRASRTSPVCFIARGGQHKITRGDGKESEDRTANLYFNSKDKEQEINVTVQQLYGYNAVPVVGHWLRYDKAILETLYINEEGMSQESMFSLLKGHISAISFDNMDELKTLGRFGHDKNFTLLECLKAMDKLMKERNIDCVMGNYTLTHKGEELIAELRKEHGTADLCFNGNDKVERY